MAGPIALPASPALRGRWSEGPEGAEERVTSRSALLGAVTDGELLLIRVLLGRRIDHRLDDLVVRRGPLADDGPLLAVPLLDAASARALVVRAAHLHRLKDALEAQLLDAVCRDVEVFDAPAHLLTGKRLVTEFRLRL